MKEKEECYMFNEFKKTFAQTFGAFAGYAAAVSVVIFAYPYIKGFVDGDKQKEEQKTKTN